MKPLPQLDQIRRVHLVGVGGIGMSGVARLLMQRGIYVSGSDLKFSSHTQSLIEAGGKIFIGHDASHVNDADCLVISSAVDADNPELQYALAHGIPIYRRAEMLAALMRDKIKIAITGTHGKTTTSGVLTSILQQANCDPSYGIGGILRSTGSNAQAGSGPFFVAEADESDASFLALSPDIIIITNIDQDHLSNFNNDFATLCKSFKTFLNQLPTTGLAILCHDDPVLMQLAGETEAKVITYGEHPQANVRLLHYQQEGFASYFSIRNTHDVEQTFSLNLPGKHNALNAMAAIIAGQHLDVDLAPIQLALSQFEGVARRNHVQGKIYIQKTPVTLINDYGHHPLEVQLTYASIKAAWPEHRVILVYQPHRYTRTKALFSAFVKALSQVDCLLLLDVYAAGEPHIDGADSDALSQAITCECAKPPYRAATVQAAMEVLAAIVQPNDVVIVQGAGNIGELPTMLKAIAQSQEAVI